VAGEHIGRARLYRGTAAERDDAALLGERPGHLGALECAECRLAVLDEDIRDAAAGSADDRLVGVVKRGAEQVGQRPAGHRLAGAGWADDDGHRPVPRPPDAHHDRRRSGIAAR
jgi:hypothetical protein